MNEKDLTESFNKISEELREYKHQVLLMEKSCADPQFLKKYANKYVSFKDGKVVASASSLSALIISLEARGLDPRYLPCRWIDPDKRVLIL